MLNVKLAESFIVLINYIEYTRKTRVMIYTLV